MASDPDGSTRVLDFVQPRTAEMPIHSAPQQAGYSYLLHPDTKTSIGPKKLVRDTGAAGVILCGEHTGTHIDALCHQSNALELYGA